MKIEEEVLNPPALWKLAIEGRAFGEMATTLAVKPLLRKAPRGDGHSVMVLPGFTASGISTRPLRTYLNELGYRSHCWNLGRNLGWRDDIEDRMLERLDHVREICGRKISLVGWSLGGVFARELARQRPNDIRQIITLGSPFAGSPRATRPWRLFEILSGMRIDEIEPERRARLRRPPPVPSTAIYSRTDGIADWRCCIEREAPMAENIEVPGSHIGLGLNPLVLHAIADRLAQPEGHWRRFRRSGLRRFLYRRPAYRGDNV